MTALLETCLLEARFGILSSVQPREVLDAASAANMHLYVALPRDIPKSSSAPSKIAPGDKILSQFGASQWQSVRHRVSVPTRL